MKPSVQLTEEERMKFLKSNKKQFLNLADYAIVHRIRKCIFFSFGRGLRVPSLDLTDVCGKTVDF